MLWPELLAQFNNEVASGARKLSASQSRALFLVNAEYYGTNTGSMTPAERRDPDLVIRSKSALSRQRRIARGAGRDADASRRFVSEFQQMRTMMQKMAAGQNPNAPPMPDEGPALNRAARRTKKKKSKKKKLTAGFG